jgi:hypothetical protein
LSEAFPLALYLDAHLLSVFTVAGLSTASWPQKVWNSTQTWGPKGGLTLEWGRSAVLVLTLLLCAMSISASSHNPFIYFRF